MRKLQVILREHGAEVVDKESQEPIDGVVEIDPAYSGAFIKIRTYDVAILPNVDDLLPTPLEESRQDVSRVELTSVFRRLLNYYETRARVALKFSKKGIDPTEALERASLAIKWGAKADAVRKVAENVGVEMPED